MNVYLQIVVGLAITSLLGCGVKPLLKCAKKYVHLTPPSAALKDKWAELTCGDEAGGIIGILERFFFFGAIWADASPAIGAWLAFKVASKWQVWSTVVTLPDSLAGAKQLDYVIARRRWSSHLLVTFLVGTLANMLIGFLGVVVGRHGFEAFRALCG
jgi:hypothetical protein